MSMKFLSLVFLLILVSLMAEAQTTNGYATHYGKKANNKKTASGAIYRKDSLVCAHRTYPFGTLLKVKNLKNDKEVIVKVIDRGPFAKKRIIDLSYAAAKELDMIRSGVVQVEVSEYKDSINVAEVSNIMD